MKMRIIQWNISYNSKAEILYEFLSNSINELTIVCLQEVSENQNKKLLNLLKPTDHAYSLDMRNPGTYEGKNRRMGVSTYIFGGSIIEKSLIDRSLFPERTLVTKLDFSETLISILNFHSLTGVGYKKGKASNFASIADFISSHALDFFSCDANEPKIDSLYYENLKFFDNGDKGRNASLIFGVDRVHELSDSYRQYVSFLGDQLDLDPMVTSHIIAKKYRRRYDHIFSSKAWSVLNVKYPYEESIQATSDHSAVIADFLFND
ncbi:hypothetical protein N9J28_00410 [bacterium]|nr:hypothetical protein [bacterium]